MDVHKRALVIGIDAYRGGIPPLASAVRDAEAVARQLEQSHGYEVTLLRDAGATTPAILTSLSTGALSSAGALPDGFELASVLFSDGDVVWIGGRDRENLPTVLEIDAGTGSVLRELRHSSRNGNAVMALALSDDGRTLATGSQDRRISLRDADTLEPLPGGEFTGHRGNVTGIAFWDGGETLISSDDAGDVLMWDVSERRQFARLGGPADGLISLGVDTATATLLAGSEDGYVWTWSLDPAEWRSLACSLAGRNMTQAEWDVYGDGGTRVRHCPAFPTEDDQVRDAEYGESLSD